MWNGPGHAEIREALFGVGSGSILVTLGAAGNESAIAMRRLDDLHPL